MREAIVIRRPRWLPRLRGRWKLVGAIAVLGLVGAPAAVWANDRFPDVPPGTGHDDISKIDDAGIVRGCGNAGGYCPDAPVTRKQMAQFLARTGGSASVVQTDSSEAVALPTGSVLGLGVTVPGLPGEVQYVAVHATIQVVVPDADVCSCKVELGLERFGPTGNERPDRITVDVPDTSPQTTNNTSFGSASLDYVFEVESGSSQIFNVLSFGDSSLNMTGYGTITATTHPFPN